MRDDPEAPPPEADPTPRLGGLARTLLIGAAAALAFVVGAAVTALLTDDGAGESVTVPDSPAGLEERIAPTERAPLPATTLAAFGDREPVDLATYRGRPALVNLWATWCAPCVKEMPFLEEVSHDLEGRVQVLGVNVQDAPANAEAFVEELGISYNLAGDPEGEFYAAVEAFGMPTTLFVDAGGTIVYRHTGILDADELRALTARHLGVRP